MVAQISKGGNMFGALAYNQNKVDSEEAKVLFSNRMLLSEDGNFSIGECMRSFEMQMPVQLSTKKPILHISINPHPEDVLTDQQLSDIAREYMRKLVMATSLIWSINTRTSTATISTSLACGWTKAADR